MTIDLGGGGSKLAVQSRSQGAALLRIAAAPGSLQALAQLAQAQGPHTAGGGLEGVGHAGQGGGITGGSGGGDLGHLHLGIDQKFLQQALVHGRVVAHQLGQRGGVPDREGACLLYTSPSPRDGLLSRMPSSA